MSCTSILMERTQCRVRELLSKKKMLEMQKAEGNACSIAVAAFCTGNMCLAYPLQPACTCMMCGSTAWRAECRCLLSCTASTDRAASAASNAATLLFATSTSACHTHANFSGDLVEQADSGRHRHAPRAAAMSDGVRTCCIRVCRY